MLTTFQPQTNFCFTAGLLADHLKSTGEHYVEYSTGIHVYSRNVISLKLLSPFYYVQYRK